MNDKWLLTCNFDRTSMEVIGTADEIKAHIDRAVFKNRDCVNINLRLLNEEEERYILSKSIINKF